MNTKFVVEHNIPVPTSSGKGRPSKYPWAVMKVGDSFFVPGIKTVQIAGVAQSQARNHGTKWTTRAVNGGARVWRIK